MTTLVDIHEDPMVSEYAARRAAGEALPIDSANAAVERAGQALAIFSEADECDKADLEDRFTRVRTAARACGLATRRGEDGLAAEFAKTAETEAVILDGYDSARLDGLQRAVPLGDVKQVKLR